MDAGPKVRQYHMLRHLAGRHEVTLVSFARPDDAADSLKHLRALCAQVRTAPLPRSAIGDARAAAKALLTGLPGVIARDESRAMIQLLHELRAAPFDAIHADQLSMAAYGLMAASRAGRRPATVLDEHNALYLLTQRMARDETRLLRRAVIAREAAAFRKYEKRILERFDAVLTVTEEDRRALLALIAEDERDALAARLTVAPICVDPVEMPVIPRATGGPPTILHLGTMFWPPNAHGVLWFSREVLPLVRQAVPDVRFVVVGKNPPREVRELAADTRVEVAGYVADPSPYLAAADAFIVPLAAGGGMRVKIVEAWARGLPVVSTVTGAEGIAAEDGRDILLTGDRDAHGFARAVIRVLTDPGLNAQLRLGGRATAEACYSWRAVYCKVDSVYEKLIP
jgi:glycosyltransferase involved in cell wall biosynthesis